MNRTVKILALVLAILPLAGCDHDDCCTSPTALVNYGPAGVSPSLVSCQSYAVLAGAGVTCLGTTVTVSGDVGCSPNGSVSGMPSGQPTNGTKHERDTHAANAQSGCAGAYADIVARPSNGTLTGFDLGGRTFSGGVYTFSADCTLNGVLILDAQNNPDCVFVFQVGNSLTCGSGSSVVLTRGAQAKNVYWQCGNNATVGNNCSFNGTVIAQNDVHCNQGSSVHGRALARNGTVTLDRCSVTAP